MSSTYAICWSHGPVETHDTYEAACAAVRAVHGSAAAIGHTDDISEGGESTLCWANDDDAQNHDGRAVAKIRVRHDDWEVT